MRIILKLFYVSLLGLLYSCESIKLSIDPQPIENNASLNGERIQSNEVDSSVVGEDHPSIACMIKKAHQIADIKWMPMGSVPSLSEDWIPAGTQMRGIPYSSVKEKDKFVGQEVSFYTFMSAVHNPRSVLYTEDVKTYPYYGENCGMYYGTVCSMAVNYALGIDRPIESKMYADLPYIAKVKQQSIEGVCAGDILWSQGHVVLVLEVLRDDTKKPCYITILESAGSTQIKQLSHTDFEQRWKRVNWVLYRYLELENNVHYKPLPFVKNAGDPEIRYDYNSDLCTSRGDYACFVHGEEITINVFDMSFEELYIYKDDKLLQVVQVDPLQEDYVLSDLPNGMYTVKLTSKDRQSNPTCFEIIDENTNVIHESDGYVLSFSSENAVPEYVVICLRDGNREAIIDISDQERLENRKFISGNYTGKYLKVFYKGKYGRVSNSPIIL